MTFPPSRVTLHFLLLSIPIHRIDVLGQRLLIMAGFTKALPVAPIPEQLRVTSMGYDVVNHSGFRVSTLFHAHSAQRVALKELLGLPLPSAAVAALPRRTGHLWMERQVFLTVLLAGFHQRCASSLLAGDFRSIWHLNLSFQGIRKAGWIFHHLGSVLQSIYFFKISSISAGVTMKSLTG